MPINNDITAAEVRVIGNEGAQLGVMGISQARKLADEAELDMVLISANANPPVVKICDYAKFRFETIKKEKEAKKAQKIVKIKEVQLSLNIQENEIAFKLKQSRKFIESGDKVKVSLRIKGRQTMFADRGQLTLNNFYDRISDIADLDTKITRTGVPGRMVNFIMVLMPKKNLNKKQKGEN